MYHDNTPELIFLRRQDIIDKSVLCVYAPGERTFDLASELLIFRRISERICHQKVKELSSLVPVAAPVKFFKILLRLLCKDDLIDQSHSTL